MKKFFKILLIVGLIATLLGSVIFAICLAASGWNFNFLSNVKTQQKTFVESENNAISTLSVDYENANVTVYVSTQTKTLTVEYPQAKNNKDEDISQITVNETANALAITEKGDWTSGFFVWNITTPTVKIYLPQERTYTLHLQTNNGNVSIEGNALQTTEITLETDNGNVTAEHCSLFATTNMRFETNNGNIHLKDLSTQSVTAETDNGNVRTNGVITATNVTLDTDNGTIRLNGNVNAQTFSATTDNGSLEATGLLTADVITLETDVGNVEATINGAKADYTITVDHDLGKSNLTSQSGGAKRLTVSTDIGEIDVVFTA